MSTAYGDIPRPVADTSLDTILPVRARLKNDQPVKIIAIASDSPSPLIECMHRAFNAVVREGNTYPHEFALDEREFRNYYLHYDAFVALKDDYDLVPTGDPEAEAEAWADRMVGMFYVKPNYPGRCSHVSS